MPTTFSADTQTRGAKSEASQGDSKKKKMLVPFSRAAKKHMESGPTFVTAPNWGQTLQANLPVYGYASAAYIEVEATGGAANVTVAKKEDAPWSVIKNLLFTDVNGTPIYNLDGYSLFLARLYGGYALFRPDVAVASFSDVAVGASASGNFKILIPVFMEFGRDGLGCLPNMDASAAYRLQISQGAPSDVYSTAPNTTVPTLNTYVQLAARSRPAASDAFGNGQETSPPAPGTVQYWTAQQFALAAGENTLQLSRVGNLIRNHILIFRATSDGTRATGETNVVPTSIEFQWDSGIRFSCRTRLLRQIAYEVTGIDNPPGVVPLLNTEDSQGYAGSEYGDDWLQTLGSTKFVLKLTVANAGTLTVLTNDVVPGAGSIFAAPYMQIAGGGNS